MSAAEDAWREWIAEEKWDLSHPDLWPNPRAAFMAGYRRALLDAADDMGEQLDTFAGRGAQTRARWSVNWLRERAAAVAPRETKD